MSLYAAYACNEGTGSTITDHSGNGRDMTISGSGNSWVTGVNYPDAFLSGTTTAGASHDNGSADAALSGDVTIMCWAQSSNGSTTQSFAAGVFSAPLTARMGLYSYRSLSGVAASPQLTVRNSSSTVFSEGSNGTTADSGWHHIAAVYHSGGTVDLYLDGTEVVTGANVTSAIGTNVRFLALGSLAGGTGAQSAINDFRVFDTALTGADIVSFMNTPVVNSSHTATASLTVTPSLSSAGAASRFRSAALTVAVALSASPAAVHVPSAALTVTPSLSAAAGRTAPRAASLTVVPSLAAAPAAAHLPSASLSVVPSFSAAGNGTASPSHPAAASLTVHPVLLATAHHTGNPSLLPGFPDLPHAVCDLLASLANGADIETPADLESVVPWIRVTRTGDAGSDRVTDRASVSVDVFAAGATEARSIAEQARQRLILSLPVMTAHGQLDYGRLATGPMLLPPTDSDNLRLVTAGYTVSMRRTAQ